MRTRRRNITGTTAMPAQVYIAPWITTYCICRIKVAATVVSGPYPLPGTIKFSQVCISYISSMCCLVAACSSYIICRLSYSTHIHISEYIHLYGKTYIKACITVVSTPY